MVHGRVAGFDIDPAATRNSAPSPKHRPVRQASRLPSSCNHTRHVYAPLYTISTTTAGSKYSQAAAVTVATGRIAAATYGTRLKISTARLVFSIYL